MHIILIFLCSIVGGYSMRSMNSPQYAMKLFFSLQKCKTEFNMEDKDFNAMIQRQIIPSSENGKCMMACFMKDTGQYHDGHFDKIELRKFNRLKWKSKRHFEKANEINSICIEQVGNDSPNECELAYSFVQCLLSEAQKAGLPPPGFKQKAL